MARSAYPLLAGGLQPPGSPTDGASPGGAAQYIDNQRYRAALPGLGCRYMHTGGLKPPG